MGLDRSLAGGVAAGAAHACRLSCDAAGYIDDPTESSAEHGAKCREAERRQ
jgi:hypothetical protein